jgi:hypothetical protein
VARAVSLAQQLEQKETMTVQYTIEMFMLDDTPLAKRYAPCSGSGPRSWHRCWMKMACSMQNPAVQTGCSRSGLVGTLPDRSERSRVIAAPLQAVAASALRVITSARTGFGAAQNVQPAPSAILRGRLHVEDRCDFV